MAKFIITVILTIVLVLSFNFKAFSVQNGKIRNHYMIKGALGYSSLLTQWQDFENVGYVGGGGGFSYQISLNKNYFISFGAEFLSINSSTKAKKIHFIRDLVDSEGDDYQMDYSLERYKEIDYTNSVFIPIFFGFKTNRRASDFYAQVGVKAGYLFSSNYKSIIKSYTTKGYYDRYIDPFENMTNHFFDTKFHKKTNPLNFNNFQLIGSVEVGIQRPLTNRNSIRFGWFLDYGLLNIQGAKNQLSDNNLFLFDDLQLNEIKKINSLYENSQNIRNISKTFITGFSVTFMIGEKQQLVNTCLNQGDKKYKLKKKRYSR